MSSPSRDNRGCRVPQESNPERESFSVSTVPLLNSAMTAVRSPLSLRRFARATERSGDRDLSSSTNSIALWPVMRRSGYTHSVWPRFIQLVQAGRPPSHFVFRARQPTQAPGRGNDGGGAFVFFRLPPELPDLEEVGAAGRIRGYLPGCILMMVGSEVTVEPAVWLLNVERGAALGVSRSVLSLPDGGEHKR